MTLNKLLCTFLPNRGNGVCCEGYLWSYLPNRHTCDDWQPAEIDREREREREIESERERERERDGREGEREAYKDGQVVPNV